MKWEGLCSEYCDVTRLDEPMRMIVSGVGTFSLLRDATKVAGEPDSVCAHFHSSENESGTLSKNTPLGTERFCTHSVKNAHFSTPRIKCSGVSFYHFYASKLA